MSPRDRKADPRWWDQTDEGYALRYRYGTPTSFDLLDVYVAALEGDEHALLHIGDDAAALSHLRRLIDADRDTTSKYQS